MGHSPFCYFCHSAIACNFLHWLLIIVNFDMENWNIVIAIINFDILMVEIGIPSSRASYIILLSLCTHRDKLLELSLKPKDSPNKQNFKCLIKSQNATLSNEETPPQILSARHTYVGPCPLWILIACPPHHNNTSMLYIMNLIHGHTLSGCNEWICTFGSSGKTCRV